MNKRRKKIVVAQPCSVFPPRGGGQNRTFYIHKALAKYYDIELVNVVGYRANYANDLIAENLREIRVPSTFMFNCLSVQRGLRAKRFVQDISVIDLYHHMPKYMRALAEATKDADLVVASHPYCYPAIREVYQGMLWYDAHNVEYHMKQVVLPESAYAEGLISLVKQTEGDCVKDSDIVTTCSPNDRDIFINEFAVDGSSIVVLPNGVDLESVGYTDLLLRRENKSRLGLDGKFVALFIGSKHEPNTEALQHIIQMAEALPNVAFLIVGSVCNGSDCSLDNVYMLGVVDNEEKDVILSIADVALNPVLSGSGTNVKMLEYAAAGLLIISTPLGNRGVDFTPNEEIIEVEIDSFVDTIKGLQQLGAEDIHVFVERCSKRAREEFSWEVIVENLQQKLTLYFG